MLIGTVMLDRQPEDRHRGRNENPRETETSLVGLKILVKKTEKLSLGMTGKSQRLARQVYI